MPVHITPIFMHKYYTSKSIAFALALVASAGVLSAKAVYIEQDGVRYYWNNTKTNVEVTTPAKGTAYVGDIVIPATITYEEKELSVTAVRSSAFSENTYLTSVTLPESVTSIGDYAFDSCEGIKKVTMPGVKTIGHWAFRNCYELETLDFSDKLESIGNYCFDKILKITSITLPETTTNLGGYVFEGNPQITTVTCKAVTPPAVKRGYLDGEEIYTIFDDNDYGDRVLFVPEESINAYKSALGWHHFGANIKAIGSSSIAETLADNGFFTVKALGAAAVEVSTTEATVVKVVNMNGQLVKSQAVNPGTTVITDLPAGVLVVNGVKVAVRK